MEQIAQSIQDLGKALLIALMLNATMISIILAICLLEIAKAIREKKQ